MRLETHDPALADKSRRSVRRRIALLVIVLIATVPEMSEPVSGGGEGPSPSPVVLVSSGTIFVWNEKECNTTLHARVLRRS